MSCSRVLQRAEECSGIRRGDQRCSKIFFSVHVSAGRCRNGLEWCWGSRGTHVHWSIPRRCRGIRRIRSPEARRSRAECARARWSAAARLVAAKLQRNRLAGEDHMPMAGPRLRPISQEIPSPRTIPEIARPISLSMTGRHGTRVKSRDRSMRAYLPLTSSTAPL